MRARAKSTIILAEPCGSTPGSPAQPATAVERARSSQGNDKREPAAGELPCRYCAPGSRADPALGNQFRLRFLDLSLRVLFFEVLGALDAEVRSAPVNTARHKPAVLADHQHQCRHGRAAS